MLAYMQSESGSDWKTIKLKSIAEDGSTADMSDVCKLVRYSCLTWTRDGKGFFYCKCVASLLTHNCVKLGIRCTHLRQLASARASSERGIMASSWQKHTFATVCEQQCNGHGRLQVR